MKEKYIYKRGNCYYFHFKIPPALGKGRIFKSLHTSDMKKAKNIRDTYLSPILSQLSAIDILEKISELISKSRNEADAGMNAIRKGTFGIDSSLKACAGRYIEFIGNSTIRKSTCREYVYIINKIVSILDSKKNVNSMSKSDAITLRDKLIDNTSSSRLSSYFIVFRMFLKWLVEEGVANQYVLDNTRITIPTVKTEKTPVIPLEKVDECMSCHPNWTLVPRIARYTGMRLREILRLKKHNIVRHQDILCIKVDERSKTGEPRIIPVADKLKDYLKDITEIEKTKKQFDHFNTLVKKIPGCEKCKFHSWRVYANTNMMEAGVDQAVRMKILGHRASKSDIHIGYTSVQISQMKKAVDLIP